MARILPALFVGTCAQLALSGNNIGDVCASAMAVMLAVDSTVVDAQS